MHLMGIVCGIPSLEVEFCVQLPVHSAASPGLTAGSCSTESGSWKPGL